MITEAQYKRFGIHDQVLDLTADQMKLKPIFESPSALARKKYDRRIVELIDRMLRRLDRLDDTVTAILETLPPPEEEYDDGDDDDDAEENDEDDAEIDDADAEEESAAVESVPVSFKFRCPRCGQKLEAELEWQGEPAECPNCHKQFNIPRQM